MNDSEHEELGEQMATHLHGLMQVLGKLGYPMVIAIQNQMERKPEANNVFPGVLMFQCPGSLDHSILAASMMLRDGFENGLKALLPGLKVDKVSEQTFGRKFAEAEQADKKVEAKAIAIPRQFLSFGNGKVDETPWVD